ncbi:MBL fold metallo-hydrolase [Vulcanisaeta distributa]|uniref:Putative mRNA 3-end processing factor n=1 Tax=Vulcanisaeta distributa (strain DSM 14429 / JCM 11212 / NBRC 100878 / IC-017) TaxID=572478 RepID=E1QS61_VULDI|nr:MBL fold metallo-hydrolase [Vulcanisaeta distributa]ADN51893.1 putative mRNA 3-end processing factor [Vulcanisaeta distributa DSM 14429]
MSRFRAYYDDGIVIEYENNRFIIDPLRKPSRPFSAVLITHGHRDHVNPRALRNVSPIIMSGETVAIIRARDGDYLRHIAVSPGSRLIINDVLIESFNAGHVVGSLSYVLDFGDLRVGVTGDFNVESSILLDGAKGLNVDVLIMEATYGDPDYVFPSRHEIYNELMAIAEDGIRDGITVFMGQPLGRGQELTALLKDYPIYVEPSIKVINNALGLRHGAVASGLPPAGSVLITGVPRDITQFIKILRSKYGSVRITALSGMYAKQSRVARLKQLGVDAIPLSSHADFPGLVDFVLSSGAEFVYTVYGNAAKFAKYLRNELNIMARPLPSHSQLTMDYFL